MSLTLWSFSDMYTSLHQTHTSKLTSVWTERKHSSLRLLTHDHIVHEHMTVVTQPHKCSRSDRFIQHCVVSENTPTMEIHFVVLLHLLLKKNELRKIKPTVSTSTSKEWLIKQNCSLLGNLQDTVNWTCLRGRKWEWNEVPRIIYKQYL